MRANKPFRYWCTKVLPSVYDDSLSYYELLNKVVEYLNSVVEDLGDAFNKYIENLDIQEEVDAKLDEMVESGELESIIYNILKSSYKVVTPEMYGAKGDGVTDDSAAFNAMFDDINGNEISVNSVEDALILDKIVLLNCATYLINQPIVIPAGVKVMGMGISNSAIKVGASMSYAITFTGFNYGEGYSVCKKNVLSGFTLFGQYNCNYGISNKNTNVWMQECVFENLYITDCNISGLCIVSAWLCRFVNIKCECAAIPFMFTRNASGNGFNNNIIENITASNFTLIGILLEAANTTLINPNVERAYQYNRGNTDVTSVIHNGQTFTLQCGIYIYGNSDTIEIINPWLEWIAEEGTFIPCIEVGEIARYVNNTFKGKTVTIRGTHIGTAFDTIFAIKSGIVEIDGLRAEVVSPQKVIVTNDAEDNTTLILNDISAYYLSTFCEITLPYGAYKARVYEPNGMIVEKQGRFYQPYLDDNNDMHYFITNSGNLNRVDNDIVTKTIFANGMTYFPFVSQLFYASNADANGYFDLGFTTPSGYSINGWFIARNSSAETDVNTSHWVQFTTLGNGHTGIRMATGDNSAVTLTSGAIYGVVISLIKL